MALVFSLDCNELNNLRAKVGNRQYFKGQSVFNPMQNDFNDLLWKIYFNFFIFLIFIWETMLVMEFIFDQKNFYKKMKKKLLKIKESTKSSNLSQSGC